MNRNSLRPAIHCLAIVLVLSDATSKSAVKAQVKQPQTKQAAKPIVANIKDQNVNDGCGCYFTFPSEEKKKFPKYVFVSDMNEKTAWMNIDGRDVKFSLKRTFTPKGEKIGSRLTRTYTANGITLSVVYITKSMCGPDEENCESTAYDATFTISKDGRNATVKFRGGCGC